MDFHSKRNGFTLLHPAIDIIIARTIIIRFIVCTQLSCKYTQKPRAEQIFVLPRRNSISAQRASQILHSVQDDRASFCHSDYPLCHSESLPVILSGSEESVFSPIIIFHILTSAHATLILRLERHSLCACLGFSTDICAGYHQYTLWKVSPLRTSPWRDRGARTCRSYIILVYNKIQKALVCGPYFRVGSTNKVYL